MSDTDDIPIEVEAPVTKKPRQTVIGSFFKSGTELLQSVPSSNPDTTTTDHPPVPGSSHNTTVGSHTTRPTSTELGGPHQPTASLDVRHCRHRRCFAPDIANPDIADALPLRRAGQLTTEQRLRFIRSVLTVPNDYAFPFTMGSGRRYYLSHKHISGRYDCFYYSPSLRGLLCMPCLLFARDGAGRGHQPIGKLVTEPLTNFKKLTGRDSYLDTHLTRNYHDNAVTSMKDLVNSKESGDVTSMLCSQHAEQVQRNRAILRAVIHEIETCGRLNLALRGHRDSGPIVPADGPECIDYGQGNLRVFLQKAALNNPVLADHLQRGPKNASYISAETQNHLISCIGSVIFKAISCEIQASSYFAIQADETSDVSKTEQLTFVVRYVDSHFNICEGFTGFIEADRTTGAAISEAILSHISKLGLNLQHMVAQSFDGASNMSGRFNGVQALIREQCPAASYVHCFSHCLNLVLNNASAVPEIYSAGAAVLAACNFLKNSPQRIKLLQQSVESISPDSRRTRLKQLCMTRWVERHDSFFVFVELFKPLLHTLTTSNEFGIVHTITETSFLVAVHILQRVLGLTRGLSVALQSKQMNYISAMSEVDSVVSTLQQWRSDDDDEEFSTVFDAAELMYADVETLPDARIPLPRLTRNS